MILSRHAVALLSFLVLFALAGCPKPSGVNPVGQSRPLPSSTADLIEILGEKLHPNRNAAIQALVAKGDEAVQPLIESMKTSEDTRQGASQALAGIGKPAVPALIEALKSPDWQVRYGVIEALKEIGPDASDSVKPLLTTFGMSRDLNERVAIMYAVAAIAPTSDDTLGLLQTALLVSELRDYSLRVLGQIGSGASPTVPRILTYIENPDTQTRYEVISALGQIGPLEGVVTAIAGRLKDSESRVKIKAADTLGTFGLAAAGAASGLAGALSDTEPEVRKAAARALGALAPASRVAIDALIKALQDTNPQVRREVANALGKLGPDGTRAVNALKRVVESDEFDYVRTAAQHAINSIEGRESTQPSTSS